jgi:hypothetical protein
MSLNAFALKNTSPFKGVQIYKTIQVPRGAELPKNMKLGVRRQCLKSGAATDTREFSLHRIFVDDVHAVMAFQL